MDQEMPKVRRSFYTVVVKRVLDIILSGSAIVVLSPLLVILSILELIFHGRPILFIQERPGLHGKLFKLCKFRSMTDEKDENGNLLPGNQRVTAFGKFIRRFSLDELPELFCIFTGKMSIIGPRPLLPEYLDCYTKRHSMRHSVRPGLACVRLKSGGTWTWQDQLENDIWYIEHISFLVDIRMMFAVAREALRGSEFRVSGVREPFIDTDPANDDEE